MLSCTEISFVISFSKFWEIRSQNGFPFTQLNQATYSKLREKIILTCFTKMIAKQSSVIQYAWRMCHMKEE